MNFLRRSPPAAQSRWGPQEVKHKNSFREYKYFTSQMSQVWFESPTTLKMNYLCKPMMLASLRCFTLSRCSPLFLVMPALFCAVNRAKRPNINRWIFNNCTSLGVHFLQLFNAHVTLLWILGAVGWCWLCNEDSLCVLFWQKWSNNIG